MSDATTLWSLWSLRARCLHVRHIFELRFLSGLFQFASGIEWDRFFLLIWGNGIRAGPFFLS
jgi:hypothetical protein